MAADIVPTKTCTVCGQELPATSKFFFLDKRLRPGSSVEAKRRGGHWSSRCKSCHVITSRKYYASKRESTVGQCSVPGCANGLHTLKRKLCAQHLWRLKKFGDVNGMGPRRQKWGRGWVDPKGYVRLGLKSLKDAGKSPFQHRVAMEAKLGRSLRPNENVHHINGIRTDNRPENLELWVRVQPCGQRPADLVAHAREILRLYEKEVAEEAQAS